MGLLKKIDEVFLTAYRYRLMAQRYAEKRTRQPESGQLIGDRHATASSHRAH